MSSASGASQPVHVTSLVVHTVAEKWQQTIDQVSRMPAVEVHSGEPVGKFIVVMETNNEQQILSAIDRIQDIDGVLNVAMVYHHVDDETSDEGT